MPRVEDTERQGIVKKGFAWFPRKLFEGGYALGRYYTQYVWVPSKGAMVKRRVKANPLT